uniref:Uncharacterized protein n=1 Tax=Anguilla anguilla TaxID=7936 RepID=A0A0E9RKE9_ANGAN
MLYGPISFMFTFYNLHTVLDGPDMCWGGHGESLGWPWSTLVHL